LAKQLIQKAKAKGVQLHLPIDSVIADKFDAAANTQISMNASIPDSWMGLDIGPQAREIFSKVIEESKTILWNGPMGVFEMEKFQLGTKAVADAVADATADGAFSLVGGGDSVEMLGVSVGEGVRGNEAKLFHTVEGSQERRVVEVVALTDIYALFG